ncbi:PREDICTED: pathogenesis-related protein 1-like [Tarenaya hassleriana]|uniref:pathogenesis-related protein 1-like n=1 Tax=Tarenaya hassleriana TaxID=28532 RepID=UPI00053C5F39|nr:PREDICTED: pathogenesis-related protein 1-like [Tarenaya hassleriana]
MFFSRNLAVFTLLSFVIICHAYRHVPNPNAKDVDLQQQNTIASHNKARAEVGVGPMTWNATLAAYAQDYANQRAKDCAMQHSSGPYGENLAAGYGRMSGPDATAYWLTEKDNYDYATNSCVGDDVCGHYTQIVWRDSVRLGCGSVQCEDGYVFVICSYDPPGNYVGQRPY